MAKRVSKIVRTTTNHGNKALNVYKKYLNINGKKIPASLVCTLLAVQQSVNRKVIVLLAPVSRRNYMSMESSHVVINKELHRIEMCNSSFILPLPKGVTYSNMCEIEAWVYDNLSY